MLKRPPACKSAFNKRARAILYYEFSFVLVRPFPPFYICALLIWNEIFSGERITAREMLQIRRGDERNFVFSVRNKEKLHDDSFERLFSFRSRLLMIRSFALSSQMNTHTPCQREPGLPFWYEHTESFKRAVLWSWAAMLKLIEIQWRINLTPPWASVAKCLMWNSLLSLMFSGAAI
jgi:hypothetical protein